MGVQAEIILEQLEAGFGFISELLPVILSKFSLQPDRIITE